MIDNISTLTNVELVNIIEEIVSKYRKDHANRSFRKNYIELYDELSKRTQFLDKFKKITKSRGKECIFDISLFERLYCLEHNLTDRPKCKTCGEKYVNFDTTKNLYSGWCCTKCINKSKEVRETFKRNFIEKYGVENPFQLDSVKEKLKNVNLNKYGCENPSQSKEIYKKKLETRAKNYYIKLVSGVYSIPVFTEQMLVENYINAISVDDRKPLKFKCKKCNKVFEEVLDDNFQTNKQHAKCPSCYPKDKHYSYQEKDVLSYIKTIYFDEILENNRNIINNVDFNGKIHWYELDIFIPNLNLAIEYNGDYHHYGDGAKDKPKNYHQMKYDMCKSKNIKLIFIRERNWLNRQDVVKDFLQKTIKTAQK